MRQSLRYASWLLLLFILLSCSHRVTGEATALPPILQAEAQSQKYFGLINDPARHVHLFLDASLQRLPAYSFHPNDNRSTVVISREEFLRYLAAVGNTYEFIELY